MGENNDDPVAESTALFVLTVGGIGVMPDPADNPEDHVIPHHEAGTRISYEIFNLGTASGECTITVMLDGALVEEVTSPILEPGTSWVGYSSLGRLTEGEHDVVVHIAPGAVNLGPDSAKNRFDVE